MDDILLESLQSVKEWLASNFEIKDTEKVDFIFGVKIHRDRSKKLSALSQKPYIKKNS